ncbi:hypothetical protein TNIN_73851 [Trichonephila inaurata madagascariensis]|uniref:Protein inscuteable homologue C-terminal domain-containing protein n=1 Tax=Trichonephila inaurata madagascariensis TaxID=2747483 RepID=A0A8X6Y201_9ARAC|nr:hypothetical protein TNIN_73851 [Trichonephila inaurata madagascariensis]
MGQHGSCIQGNPDWSGPYEKPGSKSQDADLYDQIRKFASISSNTKDLQEFEKFLKNQINPTCPQHGTKSLYRSNSGTSSTSSKNTTSSKYEELFHKESSCKDINFNQSQMDTKIPSIEPIIAQKSTCKVHGHLRTHETSSKPSPCRVHGSSTTGQLKVQTTKSDDSLTICQDRNKQPPIYRHPPQKQTISQPLIIKQEFDNFSDEDSAASTFSCPEFLTNLILPSEEIETLDILASVGVQSAKEIIQRLEDRAESIVETFGVVLKHLEHGDWSTFCISTSRLCDDIKNVMRDYHLSSEVKDVASVKIRNHVTEALNQLTTHILSLNQVSSSETNHNVLLPSFKVLGEALHEMMEFLISKELKVLIECLNPDTKNSSIRMATCALAEMSLSGALMSRLIVQAGAILPLLNICKVRKCKYLRPLALRVLTVICSSQMALAQFEKSSGFSIILTLLSEESEEKVVCEIVGFLAQILKQWSENKCSIGTKIGQDLDLLVQHLTEAAKKALSPEMFLLSAACLATLSSCNSKATKWLELHAQEMRLLASGNKQESYV